MPSDSHLTTTFTFLRQKATAPSPAGQRRKEELEAWQRDFRPYLWKLLGLNRIAARCSADPQAQQVGVEELNDHIREEWKLETEPGFWVPFYLLRPKSQDGPVPLVITPHGHGKAAKRPMWAYGRPKKNARVLKAANAM